MAYDQATEESEPVIVTQFGDYLEIALDDGRQLLFDRAELHEATAPVAAAGEKAA